MMADEDEIDILGDFTLDNLLSKNELYQNSGLVSQTSDVLNCDCSSQWLLDQNTTANSTCWYNNGHSEFSDLVPDNPVVVHEHTNSNCGANQISTENAVCDESGWTKKEKNLLDRGIEIFGKSNMRLSQFIGSKTSGEVKYYLKHFYDNAKMCLTVSQDSFFDNNVIEETIIPSHNIDHVADDVEFLEDSEIPASIEEVIAAVSTAKPTVQINPKKARKNPNSKHMKINYEDIPIGHSILKSNVFKNVSADVIDTEKTRNKSRERSLSPNKKHKRKNLGEVKFKFRTKMKVNDEQGKKQKKSKGKIGGNFGFTDTSLAIIEEAKPVILNVNGEEIVKIKKENTEMESESDIEIDVENDNDDYIKEENEVKKEENITSLKINVNEQSNVVTQEISKNEEADIENNKDLSEWSEEVTKQLLDMNGPIKELVLSHDVVTDLEKCIHSEFFEGRATKTPGRYLKIRNHILNAWYMSKPLYVTKTSIRPGLKNCGDVNCIGRIHHFLEQIGAINFGCAQTSYVRPLSEMLWANVPAPKERVPKDLNLVVSRPIALSRPRIKKKFTNDGEGGCTLTHDEKGDVINTTVVNEEPALKPRVHLKKPSIRLIYCKEFTDDHPQEFSVHLHLSTLILMDLHAHTSHTEVMGLIGGYWNPNNKILTIMRYVPCRNVASSATHCDMCPISQAAAADIIHSECLNILGWFHSHPTFAPEPSQQDLDTQLSVQQWIGTNKPCIGLILSPFSAHGALIASPFRCLIVDKKHNFEDQFMPFKFKVELISSNFDTNYLLSQAWRIFNTGSVVSEVDRVDFNTPYFLDQSITYFDKFMSSVRMHLAKCSNINKRMYDMLTEGFISICCKHSSNKY